VPSAAPPLRRLGRLGLVLALLTAPVLPGLAAGSALAAPVPAGTSSLVLTNPAGPTDDLGRPSAGGTQLRVTMTPDPTKGVTAGDTVKVTFSGMQPYYKVSLIGMCPTALSPTAPVADPAGFVVGPAQCTAQWPTGIDGPIDANGQTVSLSTTTPKFPLYARATDDSVTVDFLVGAGKPNNPGVLLPGQTDGKPNADYPTCDTENACTIGFGVQVSDTARTVWSDTTSVVVRPALPSATTAAGCGSPGTTSLATQGPERAQGEVARFNSGLCAGSGQELPMSLVGEGEGDGLRALGDTADLAFAGSGLLGSPGAPETTQPHVLTPVGLNAVVLAQVGGVEAVSNTPGAAISGNPDDRSAIPSGTPADLPAIALTQADVASILVHDFPSGPGPGAPPFSGPPQTGAPASSAPRLYTSIVSNPANADLRLADSFDNRGYALPYSQAPTTVYPTGADSTPATLSAQLHHDSAAKGALVVPSLPVTVSDGSAGTAVPEFTDFSAVASSDGSLVRQTSSVAGIYSSIFGKDTLNQGAIPCPNLDPADGANQYKNSCAKFVVTDLVTATSLGLPVARIQNSGGAYTSPTAESLQAAAAQGSVDPAGLFTPSLDTTGAAYPLTFVEYAVSQASPLLDSSCAIRSGAQDALRKVVGYLADGGQQSLAPGLAALPASLSTVARSSVAAVGASPTSAGPCRAATVASVTGGDAGSAGSLAAGFPGSAGSSLGSLLSAPAGAAGPVDAAAVQLPTDATAAAVANAADQVDIPVFGQAGPLGPLGPLVGLVALVAITSGSGVLASQRLTGKTFGDVRAWFHRTFVGVPTTQTVRTS
jgi:hypothetical protein